MKMRLLLFAYALLTGNIIGIKETGIWAGSCDGWCDPPNSWKTIKVYCYASGYDWSQTLSTDLHVYTVADCLAPVQAGVLFHYTDTTTRGSVAYPSKCDAAAGYVGTPITSSVTCSVEGHWGHVDGCTDTCDGEFECWPGECGGGKVSYCHCSPGFYKLSDITCELNNYGDSINSPSFENCYVEVIGPNGEKKASSSTSHQCSWQNDFYGNFHPAKFHYDLMVHFDPGFRTFPAIHPYFVTEYKLGITDVWYKVLKIDTLGNEIEEIRGVLMYDDNGSRDVLEFFPSEDDADGFVVRLQDRESLCLEFNSNGGGYRQTNTPSFFKSYTKVKSTQRRCYHFDASPPIHCVETLSYEPCDIEPDPLVLVPRISRSPNINVYWQGWIDAAWVNDAQVHRSGIESFTVVVNEMVESNGALKVDTGVVFSNTVSRSETQQQLDLPASSPKLFCVTLEVKDVADNVGFARRFILYDNSSYVSTHEDESKFFFNSATSDTDYQWQTNLNEVCVTWTDYFHNLFYLENHLLDEIEPDPHGHISGIYEQESGDLPVSGTPNIHGIITFIHSYAKNDLPFFAEVEVPNVLSQTHCESMGTIDGDVATVRIKAIDIIGNEYVDNRTVFIDSSPPELESVGLVRGGLRMLTVHHNTDLSTMDIQLNTRDPHSGIQYIEWEFGETDFGEVFHGGAIAPQLMVHDECIGHPECYCPIIGDICEDQRYSIPLHGLVNKFKHIGDHNRDYFFAVTVTNNANLITTQRIEVLVDDSEPQTGVVLEGPIWNGEHYPDIDYTSASSFLVHWYGFLDHESEIRFYRLALDIRCLSVEEVVSMNATSGAVFYDVLFPNNAIEIPANFTGRRFVSIVALNNAMEPSAVVCSDGISRDIYPPKITDIRISHASWTDSIYCHNNETWFLRSDLTKVKIPYSEKCACGLDSESPFAEALPIRSDIQDYSSVFDYLQKLNQSLDYLCSVFSEYDSNKILYLPNDRIEMQWSIENDISQSDEFLVGFGTSAEEEDTPILVDYVSTHSKRFINIHHAAIGTDELFFIFLKAASKSGLSTVIPIGPVLIDETPPIVNTVPEVMIGMGNIIVGWNEDAFHDDEQTTPIDRIKFEIGHGDIIVTPTLQWRYELPEPCDGFSGGCLRYPLSDLQIQDTDLGLSFYMDMHIFNKAGHSVTITTSNFTIPSMYPPTEATVIDLDPNFVDDFDRTDESKGDIDAHLSSQKLCAVWNEFTHHDDVKLEFGVGTLNKIDDVYAFSEVADTNKYCVVSENIPEDVVLFVRIRATTSGGSTISSSDGVIILNENRTLEQLEILDGPSCITPDNMLRRTTDSIEGAMVFNPHLSDGQIYTLRVNAEDFSKDDIDLKNLDAHIKYVSSDGPDIVNVVFQPYYDMSNLNLGLFKKANITTDVYSCEDDISLQTARTSLHAHWRGLSEHFIYEVAAVKFRCDGPSEKCRQFLSSYVRVDRDEVEIADLQLKDSETYFMAVRPCLNDVCLGPKLSSGVSIEKEHIHDHFTITKSSTIHNNDDCSDLHVDWDELIPEARIVFYKWTVISYVGISGANATILPWSVVPSETARNFSVQECVTIPVHAFKQMYACVRAYSYTGLIEEKCRHLVQESEYNDYKTTVYDLDANSDSWKSIKKILNSEYIGDAITKIHDAEVDVANKKSVIIGAILNGKARKIKWFLTTSPTVPEKCKAPVCKTAVTNLDGYIKIPRDVIKYDTVHYICAKASEIIVRKNGHDETLPEIKTCSNGFIIDDSPPTGGELYVNDDNGYITNLQNVQVMWSGFGDTTNVAALGYDIPISSYTVSIGSSKYGSDIFRRAVDGHRSFMKLSAADDLVIPSGTFIFVSVTAYDHVGLSTSISSEQLIVDTTPPTRGFISSPSLKSQRWLGDNYLGVHVTKFNDKESGIDKYIATIGSSHHYADILTETAFGDALFEIDLKDTDILDGHTYYLGVKAVNRAGLSSEFAYLEFSVDHSPPTGGHVMDGDSPEGKDVDYQSDTTYISGHWKGFMDSQSGIAYYRVGLGSQPFEYDVEPIVYVGLNKEIIWKSSFIPGERYFITVEACNGAGLCVARASDGIVLDDSPPVSGKVFVGSSTMHKTFIPHRSFIELSWFGFEDPQSDMRRYEACIGTMPYGCEVVPVFNCNSKTSHIQGELDLPNGTALFATVRGYNHNNQSVSKASQHFIVDTSPPIVSITPGFKTRFASYNTSSGYQWDQSVLQMYWGFEDAESPVTRHIFTLKTHHDGHTPVEHLELGKEHEITLALDETSWLHNGDTYTLVVTACNDAGLCTTAEAKKTLTIDSTPPHLGGIHSPISWENILGDDGEIASKINMSWYGFYDYESGISKVYVGIGKSFTGNELTNGLVEVDVDTMTRNDNHWITTNEGLLEDESVIVSLMAENGVGLVSPMARVTMVVSSTSGPALSPFVGDTGSLEIERHSCEIHFCNKDCTCAVVGQGCIQVDTNRTCNSITETDNNQFGVDVLVYAGVKDDSITISPSSSCLAAHWVVDDGISAIKRFEWTIGLKNEPFGEGIFDLAKESPWIDVGKFQHSVFCLPPENQLLHGTEYIIYVKAWVDMATSLIFESAPVLIDRTSPSVSKGKYIKDSDESCVDDYDIIDWTDKITACWDSVFYEPQGQIVKFLVSLGTQPGVDDVVEQTYVGLQTRFSAFDLTLLAGQYYYFTVIAYNDLGMRTVLSSSGFIVDLDGPIAGVLYNTDRNRNYAVQSSNSTFDLTWHGFMDLETGVKGYYVALFEDNEFNEVVYNFTYVNIQTSITLTNLSLIHGKRYFGAVKAINTGDILSDIVISESKLIDTTPPAAYPCELRSIAYEDTSIISKSTDLQFPDDFNANTFYIISGQINGSSKYPQIQLNLGQTISSNLPINESHDGRLDISYKFLSNIQGVHNITLKTDSTDSFNLSVQLYTCGALDIPDNNVGLVITQVSSDSFKARFSVMDTESGIKSAYIGFGSSRGGLQLKSLDPIDVSADQIIPLSVKHEAKLRGTVIVENLAGLKSTFHSNELTVDHTAPVLDDIHVETELDLNMTTLDPEAAMMQFNVTWNVAEDESGIKACFAAIGTARFTNDLQWYREAISSNTFLTDWIQVFHGDSIYVRVKCVNNIEMSTTEVFGPITVSLDRPLTKYAHLNFIPLSQFSTKESIAYVESTDTKMAVQTDQNSIQFHWVGFFDMSGIQSFVYRLSQRGAEWINAGLKDIAKVEGNFMNGRRYTIEVCAVNMGNLRGDAVSATMLVEGRSPRLTGKSISMSANVIERNITLDWTPVFALRKNIPVFFEVTIGSDVGRGDVLEEPYIIDYTLSFIVTKRSILTDKFAKLYIVINAVYSTGERAVYTTSYTLPF